MAKPTLHVVYSTVGWVPNAAWQKDLDKKSKKEREDFIKYQSNIPNCCDMTLRYFREMLVEQARLQGFEVVRWPVRNRDAWMAVGEAARNGEMVPGSAAVLCHSWSSPNFERECVPSWDFYPVLNDVMATNDMIYPHPKLDQLHSEKRYTSSLMAPTRFIHFLRGPNGWKVRGHGDKDVGKVVTEELKRLQVQASAKGLAFEDIMVKQGLSWGGEAVTRLAPGRVQEFVTQKMLPKLPGAARKLTVLLQAKLEIVSELRWCMVEGELRSREWKSLNCPRRGQLACDADYQDQHEARKLVEKFCKQMGKYTIDELEESMSHLCKKVYSEAVSDAGGEQPLYLRVDLLLDKQGRVWLGERESWGADLNGNDETFRMDPTYKELAMKMLAKTKRHLRTKRMIKSANRKVQRSKKTSTGRNLRKGVQKTIRKASDKTSLSPSKRGSAVKVGAHGGA